MPKANEIAVVTAGGQKYDNWKTVEVHRAAQDVVIHALLTVAEISTGAKNFAAIKLKPADIASITLAGQPAITGFVYLRQASCDATQHGVQIGIASKTQDVMPGTVENNPGQYIDQTLQQIGSAAFGKVGVTFAIAGNPAGVDIPFAKVSEHVGETPFEFVERLCRMRNIHMIDDGKGGVIGFRGATQGGSLVLQEGKNILRASITLKNNESVEHIEVVGQNQRQDSGDANRNQTATAEADPTVTRLAKIAAEMPGIQAEMQMRADHEKDWIKFEMVDGTVTVPGWLCPDGSLWMAHVLETVTVNSPLLLPENSMEFMIKGVVHRQSSEEGTTTDVLLCSFDGLGSGTGEPLKMK